MGLPFWYAKLQNPTLSSFLSALEFVFLDGMVNLNYTLLVLRIVSTLANSNATLSNGNDQAERWKLAFIELEF
jgi:hypothetical protein